MISAGNHSIEMNRPNIVPGKMIDVVTTNKMDFFREPKLVVNVMRKNFLIVMLTSIFIILMAWDTLWAGEVDILINKLVDKNILTQSEATMLLDEMRVEKKKEEQEKLATDIKKEDAKDKPGLPGWAERTKIKGDVRVRYQTQDRNNDGSVSRSRGRARVRAGIESTVNDQWKTGIGMASGGTDPRSNNQTLDDTFSTKGWGLDYAYVQYAPVKNVNITAGKFKNPIWKTKDLLWDSDINPEGIAATINHKATDNLEFFVTPAFFLLEEIGGSKNDPALIAIQPGLTWKITKNTKLKLAATYYDFKDVKGSDLSVHSSNTNSTDPDGNWLYEHDSISFDAEIGFNLNVVVKYGALFGQFVSSDADIYDQGWLLGFKAGDKTIEHFGQWQFKYNYRRLEKDAWPDFFPDSDFYSGETGVKGSEFELTFGLGKNVTFGLDYYMSKPIGRDAGQDENLFQTDLIVKF